MTNRLVSTTFATTLAVLGSLPAEAGDDLDACPIFHHQRLHDRDLITSSQDFTDISPTNFGAAVAINGSTAVVGAPTRRVLGQDDGAATVYGRSGRQWIAQQLLTPPQYSGGKEFGTAIAVEADALAAGAPGLSGGAVYVYNRQGGQWQYSQKLTALDPLPGARFGQALALMADTMVVGAPKAHGGAMTSGAAYVFQFNGTAWVQVAKLIAADSAVNDEFGAMVALEGDVAVVASVKHAGGAGAIYVFRASQRGDNGWTLEQKLTAPDQQPLAQFGQGLAIRNGVVYVGAPRHSAAGKADAGALFVYTGREGRWSLAQTLVAPDSAANDRFGMAVAVDQGALVVTASRDDVQPSPELPPTVDAGSGYVFEWQGAWQFQRKLLARELWMGTVNAGTNGRIGRNVALSEGSVFIGSEGQEKAAFVFDLTEPTCDGGGEADPCDRDRNNNLQNDRCEITSGTSSDCNADGVPDEAQAGTTYTIDTGIFGSSLALVSPRDVVWLTQFTVQPGGEHITHIAVPWPGTTLVDWPATVVIYRDPNNDGLPYDAVLLGAWPTRTVTLWGNSIYSLVTTIAVDRTYVGPPGQSFFVGVFTSVPAWVSFSMLASPPLPQRCWYAIAPPGSGNVADLHTFSGMTHMTLGRFRVRALSLDCNGNGAWDSCDIETGASLDRNLNGIPDECEPCLADLEPRPSGDGQVDLDDLLAVLEAWGACDGCPQDITGDGQVDFDDVLAVIFAWGACG